MPEHFTPEFELKHPLPSGVVEKIPARTLAYIGDSVFELSVRFSYLIRRLPQKSSLHGGVVSIVCAENQALLFEKILDLVPEFEKSLLKNWRNAKMPKRSTNVPRTVYAKSTALEAWIGYLFLTGQKERLRDFIKEICTVITETG